MGMVFDNKELGSRLLNLNIRRESIVIMEGDNNDPESIGTSVELYKETIKDLIKFFSKKENKKYLEND